jgi:hypothetical protein
MATPRDMFFDATWISQDNREALQWGQGRVRLLEQHNDAIEDHLQERNATIDRLEQEIQRLNNVLLGKSTSQESDEELHQRRRRERMLDEVTLICVRDGIERMNCDPNAEDSWGRRSRDSAENICDGIMAFDAKQ